MSIISTTLVFAGVPLAVVLVIYGTVFAGTSRRSRRYRPGRPFDFIPVWFLSSPELLTGGSGSGHAALAAAERPALTASSTDWPPTDTPQEHVTGGASDRW